MAQIENTGEVECYKGEWRAICRFIGRGWGRITFDEIGWGKFGGEFEPIIFEGNLSLRVLYVQRGFVGFLYVLEADNGRWPIWWVLLHLWRFTHWFERNLRLTAAVWGLIKYDIGASPRWRDFMLLRWIRQWRKPKVFTIDMLDKFKTWPPQT